MSSIFAVKELELKKKALAAESEVYREMLKLEVRNLGLYYKYLKVKTSKAPFRLLKFVTPLAGLLARRRKPKTPRLITTALLGWQVYNRVLPWCRAMFASRGKRIERFEVESEPRVSHI
jgi:hypothetical protein